ncbi:hypothetical protein BU082_13115 [Staphylococcus warneri]|nr:hypothetical protein [Staphylococcus warneri]PTI16402.1 hypothetical protein BU082_13115 [Staphylococcus warneri]
MINMEFINNKFKQKINSNTTIVSLYSSPLFTEFYNQLIKQDNFYNDLNFYQKNILKKEKSIELASGSGRILIPMLKEGYNIIGIEK